MFDRLLSLAFLTAISISCVTTATHDDTGFKHKSMNYGVTYKDPAQKSLMGSTWIQDKGFRSPVTIQSLDLEEVVEVADVDQIKLNPNSRLIKFKTILVRPAAPKGWTFQNKKRIETGPGILIITYSMDHSYYEEYLPEFEEFVNRITLR